MADADLVTLARRGFDTVAAAAIEMPDGLAWSEFDAVSEDLYAGTAGMLLGATETLTAGVDGGSVRAVAAGARDHLVAIAGRGDGAADGLFDGNADGLFGGTAGAVVALRAWGRAAADDDAVTAASLLAATIADQVRPGEPCACTDIISGDAGVLLALLPDVDRDPRVAGAAATLADRLVAAAETTPSGPQWRMTPGYEILMPNFSHGTAGVAYALVLTGKALGRPDLVDVGVSGARTLLTLGDRDGRWALPMSIPRQSHRPEVAYGWCHGPSGTMRLFSLLSEVDGSDPRWKASVAQCTAAVLASGLPERLHPGFWDNLARCCGTASVGTVFLDRYQATGDPALLAFVDRLAADVAARADVTPVGVAWSNTEHTADPPQLPAEPGFMQGAAGIASWLARVAAVRADRHAPAVDLGVVPGWI